MIWNLSSKSLLFESHITGVMLTNFKSKELDRLIIIDYEEDKNNNKATSKLDNMAANVDGVGCMDV